MVTTKVWTQHGWSGAIRVLMELTIWPRVGSSVVSIFISRIGVSGNDCWNRGLENVRPERWSASRGAGQPDRQRGRAKPERAKLLRDMQCTVTREEESQLTDYGVSRGSLVSFASTYARRAYWSGEFWVGKEEVKQDLGTVKPLQQATITSL